MISRTHTFDPARIEILTWSGCPSHLTALTRLTEVLIEIGRSDTQIDVTWVETDEAAEEARFVGSPTFRVGGVDLFAPEPSEPFALACRVYRMGNGRVAPIPDHDSMATRLRAVLDTVPLDGKN